RQQLVRLDETVALHHRVDRDHIRREHPPPRQPRVAIDERHASELQLVESRAQRVHSRHHARVESKNRTRREGPGVSRNILERLSAPSPVRDRANRSGLPASCWNATVRDEPSKNPPGPFHPVSHQPFESHSGTLACPNPSIGAVRSTAHGPRCAAGLARFGPSWLTSRTTTSRWPDPIGPQL